MISYSKLVEDIVTEPLVKWQTKGLHLQDTQTFTFQGLTKYIYDQFDSNHQRW